MTPTEIKLKPITISFGYLYDLLFQTNGLNKEFVEIPKWLFEGLYLELPEAFSITQIIITPEAEPSNTVTYTLWRKDAWNASAERFYRDKILSDKRVRVWELRKKALRVMTRSIVKMTSLDSLSAEGIAERILARKSKDNASKFGVVGEEWNELWE